MRPFLMMLLPKPSTRRVDGYRMVKYRLSGLFAQYGIQRKASFISLTYLSRRSPVATLQELLLTPEKFPHLVADTKALVQGELDCKGGISGTAVKAAYKVVTAFAPGYYEETLSAMLPDMVNALAPYWADFTGFGGGEFGDYLVSRSGEVSESLLAVTDNMAELSGRAAVVKAYQMVRGGASKNIEAALPALGAMVQKFA
jgi:hypothetical protein